MAEELILLLAMLLTKLLHGFEAIPPHGSKVPVPLDTLDEGEGEDRPGDRSEEEEGEKERERGAEAEQVLF